MERLAIAGAAVVGAAGGGRRAGRARHADGGAVVGGVGRALRPRRRSDRVSVKRPLPSPVPDERRVVEVVQRDRVEQAVDLQLAVGVVRRVALVAVADVGRLALEQIRLGAR